MTATANNFKLGSQASFWAERTTLLPARIRYLFSLETRIGASTGGELANINAASSVEVDGVLRIPPRGGVRAASTMRGAPTFDALKLEGDLIIDLEDSSEMLRVNCSGVFLPSRGAPGRLGDKPGDVYLSSSQECPVPSLRWLTRTRLFAVGKIAPVMAASADGSSKPLGSVFDLSLDFHVPVSFP